MITLVLVWINAKYKHDYMALFVGTVVIDLAIIDLITKLTA